MKRCAKFLEKRIMNPPVSDENASLKPSKTAEI